MSNEPQIKEEFASRGLSSNGSSRIGKSYPISKTITVESKRVTTQDIAKWKTAIQAAKSALQPRRRMLYELYDSITIDGHLESVMEKMIASVANKRLVFVPHKKDDGMDVEFINENIINTPWMRKLIKYRMEAKAFGHSLAELIIDKGMIADAKLCNRLNVVPERGWLAIDYNNLEGSGIAYRHDKYYKKYLIEFGEEKDLGKLLNAAQYVIYKRGGIGDYAQCVELFGMPFREARYNPFNPGDREKLDEAMSKAGAAGYAVIPDGSSIEFHNVNVGTGGKDLYMGLIKEVCNEELSKIFLGNTLTTSQGENGARSLGDVHKEAENELLMSHLIETEYDLNWNVKDVLSLHGVPNLNKGKFMFQESSDMDLDKRIGIDIQLFNSGAVEFPENYWYETYGIQKPDGAERKAKGAGGSGNNKGGEPPKEPSNNDDDEADAKLKIAANHKPEAERSRSLNVGCCSDPRHAIDVVAAYNPDAEEEAFLKTLFDGDGNKYDLHTFQKNATALISEMQDGLQPSMVFGEADTVAATMMEMNLQRFSFNKNLAQVLELNQAVKATETFEQFREEASKILGKFNENYLRTEQNMAQAVGQNSRDYLRIIDTQDAFPYVRYRTVGDDNVRQSHAALDGRIFEVAKNDWRSFVPPNGYNCRCSLESLASLDGNQTVSTGADAGKSMGAEFTQMRKEGFAVNRADLGIVFDLNKEYAETLRGTSTSISGIGYKEGNLDAHTSIAGKLSNKLPASDVTLKDAQELHRNSRIANENVMLLSADGDLPIGLEFAAIGKNRKHIKQFDALPSLIQQPDELYMVTETLTRYIQHYADGMLVADVALNDGKPTIGRWFTSTKDNIRKGLLLKSK
jgi:SPP1 gp7 family putative phage head morphogenesis protein